MLQGMTNRSLRRIDLEAMLQGMTNRTLGDWRSQSQTNRTLGNFTRSGLASPTTRFPIPALSIVEDLGLHQSLIITSRRSFEHLSIPAPLQFPIPRPLHCRRSRVSDSASRSGHGSCAQGNRSSSSVGISAIALLCSVLPLRSLLRLRDCPKDFRFVEVKDYIEQILRTASVQLWQSAMAGEEERTLVEILDEETPLDIVKYIDYVREPQCGAIATFSGTTRDTFDDKTVVELRYEAYVPMAVRCIKSMCSSARSTWSLGSIAVAHKLGPVPVGETSVFIAISSVHRVDALDACKFLIDELKATVPIWKKEVYANGEVWKENREFLERRSDLGKDGEDSKAHHKKGCCGVKIRVDDEAEVSTKLTLKVYEKANKFAPVTNHPTLV